MIKTLSVYDFVNEWNKWEDRKDTFTYEGKKALFDYLEQYEDSTGEPLELDIIALCCEYTEYESAWDAMYQYQPKDMPTVDDEPNENGVGMDLVELGEAQEKIAHEWLKERTTVIDVDGGGVIIANF
jgi:hypothetical protein